MWFIVLLLLSLGLLLWSQAHRQLNDKSCCCYCRQLELIVVVACDRLCRRFRLHLIFKLKPTRVKLFCTTLEKIYMPHEYLTTCGTCNTSTYSDNSCHKALGGDWKARAGRGGLREVASWCQIRDDDFGWCCC